MFTLGAGGGWLGVAQVLIEVAVGVGIGVAGYVATSILFKTDITLQGLGNAALDAFLVTSAIVFVSSGINFVKHIARNRVARIERRLARRAEKYRQSLSDNLTKQQLDNLQFATATYDVKRHTYTYAFNSETDLVEGMLNPQLQSMRVRTSCAEIQAVNKALNAGSRLGDLYIYTIKAIDGTPAYACRVCSRVLGGNVAGIFTGLFT